jgi:hypothetical protein
LKTFQDLDVGCGSRAPELDTISPDRFEDGFVGQDVLHTWETEVIQSFSREPKRKTPPEDTDIGGSVGIYRDVLNEVGPGEGETGVM